MEQSAIAVRSASVREDHDTKRIPPFFHNSLISCERSLGNRHLLDDFQTETVQSGQGFRMIRQNAQFG